jgi:predicted solute-binding protein
MGKPLIALLSCCECWKHEFATFPSPLSLYLVERERERDSPHMVKENVIIALSVSMIDRSNSQQVMLLHYRRADFLLAPATC